MTVVFPYAEMHPDTAAVAARVHAATVFVGDRDQHYYELVRSLWRQGNGWLNVEHDLVPTFGQIDDVQECPADWCAIPYTLHHPGVVSLGFMKFGPRLIARHPDLLDNLRPEWRCWGSLDGFTTELRQAGEGIHIHPGEVVHHHREAVTPHDHRRSELAHLVYTGDGSRYLHEDMSVGIPPIPAADFDTDDERVIAICLESGLYRESKAAADDKTVAKKGDAAEAADAAN